MPPKVTPKRQPPRRNAGGPPGDEPQNAPSPKEPLQADSEATKGLEDVTVSQDVEMHPSEARSPIPPQSSLANSARPPARRPVQRIDSVHRRGNTRLPPMNITQTVPGTRPILKYQPKSSTRRSKEEREAQEQAEEERSQARLTTEGALDLSSNSRGGFLGRGGRGGSSRAGFRGGMSGWRAVEHTVSRVASGPLGGGYQQPVAKSKRKATRGDPVSTDYLEPESSTSQPKATTAIVKKEATVKAEKEKGATLSKSRGTKKGDPKIKDEEQIPTCISSDDELDLEEGPRVNIELINLVSDDETEKEAVPAEDKEQEKPVRIARRSLRPVRLDRNEHIERAIAINTDVSSLTSAQLRKKARERNEAEGSLFLASDEEPDSGKKPQVKAKSKSKDVEFIRDERRWKGVYPDEDEKADFARVKEEPKDDDIEMVTEIADANRVEENHSAPTSGEVLPASVPNLTTEKVVEKPVDDPSPLLSTVKRRRKPPFHDPRPVLQTKEDHEEWKRYEDDVTMLGVELGSIKANAISAPTERAADGDTTTEAELERKKDRKEGLVYLFQFPPVMPSLIRDDRPADVEETQPQETRQGANSDPPTDTTRGAAKVVMGTKPAIKTEEAEANLQTSNNLDAFTAHGTEISSGYVGMLRVHQSGAVILGWGDLSLELARGGEGELLQDVITSDIKGRILGSDDMDEGEGSGFSDTISMGQLTGGFVVTPDWTTIFDTL
ncbi:hypothetical protein MMC06_001730 [Schaereria dolodes]|nr:hypothetical protein [Schaereria dolodes]